jgi:hypothetical protein
MKKFDITILNPPYDSKNIHYKMIRVIYNLSKRKVIIIPSREGDIPIRIFDNVKEYKKLKIYSLQENEKLKYEIWTKFPQSDFYIHVPRQCFLMKQFYETGEYKTNNKKSESEYATFSFNNETDLELFKKRLYEKGWIKNKGFVSPNYNDILFDISYIKKYKEI